MTVNFLDELNDSNSVKEGETIILTSSKYEIEGTYQIKSPCKISSNCDTVIICEKFEISSELVSLDGITFETSIHASESDNFQMTNCVVRKSDKLDGALCISNSKSVFLSHINISGIGAIPGIYITSSSTVNADNISVSQLEETLIVCNTNSNLYLKESNIHHSKANGIYTSNDSYIEVRNCTISDTEYPSIFVSNSNCVLENNVIQNIAQNGISLNTVKSFVVCKNKISDVSGSAISIMDDSVGVAHRNIIKKIGGNGIYVSGNSEVKAYKNEISDNQYPGIAILMKSKAKLIKNKISNIGYSGICARGAKSVKILKSDISNINECGISVSDTKKCVIKYNDIKDCKIAAVESYNKSKVYIIENNIINMKEYGFLVYTSGYMKAKNNTISDVGKAMVKLLYKGGGDFISNKIQNCPNQKDSQTANMYFLSDNGNFPGVTNDPSRQTESIQLDEDYVDCNKLCIKCNKNPRNCFLLDCGHKVYCKECAEKAFNNGETCPLCRFPITKVTGGFATASDDMCVICFNEPADSIVAPCGHMGICHHCLEQWFIKNKNCPICRTEPATFKVVMTDL